MDYVLSRRARSKTMTTRDDSETTLVGPTLHLLPTNVA
jgi:hypothetical protein